MAKASIMAKARSKLAPRAIKLPAADRHRTCRAELAKAEVAVEVVAAKVATNSNHRRMRMPPRSNKGRRKVLELVRAAAANTANNSR